jgi:radical SAM superfamily enzyme YgiQ (UPF0313 family)
MTDILIVTVPHTYTFGPSLAPALLKSCVQQEGLTAQAWDLSAEFNANFKNHTHYNDVTAWLAAPELPIDPAAARFYFDTVKQFADRIIAMNPRYLALSILTYNSLVFAEDLCYHVTVQNPDIKIVLGGSGLDVLQHDFNAKWYDLMLDSGLANTVIVGEGEKSLAWVVKNAVSGVVNVPQLGSSDLDSVPFPDYDDYDFSFYNTESETYWLFREKVREGNEHIFLITASKGCVKSCSFCDVGKIWSRFRYRSGERVAEEILYLHQRYGAKYFSFTDSLMNGGLKPYAVMNEILAERLPDTVKYDGQIICRSQRDMPERYFECMSRAGCHFVSIGMESGSEQVRMHMGKGSRQEDVNYTTEMLIKFGIRQGWNIIAGYPTETDLDWQQTMDLIKHWLPRSDGLLQIQPIDTFQMLAGTPMTETDMFHDLNIKTAVINSYSSFAWTTGSNVGNTLETRAARFIELCDYLLEFDPVFYRPVKDKIDRVNRRLSWYRDAKSNKKIFHLSKA